MISIVAAMSMNGIIGRGNRLPFKVKEDLQNFKNMTMGNTVVMGRKTYESIGSKPLPSRRNVVVTSQNLEGVETVSNIKDALNSDENVFVIGGQLIYEQTIDYADELLLTLVHGEVTGDTYFPTSKMKNFNIVEMIDFYPSIRDTHKATYYRLVKA